MKEPMRFFKSELIVLLISMNHLLLVVFVLELTPFNAAVGLPFALFNAALLIHFFIRSIQHFLEHRGLKNEEQRMFVNLNLLFGGLFNAAFIYAFFLLMFSQITTIAAAFA